MAMLKNNETGQDITRFVSFKKAQEVNLTVQTALDGTEYLTRFGRPVYSYELEVHVNRQGKALLEEAADTLAELEVTVRSGVYTGRIKSMEQFEEEYYGWYKTTVVLSAVSEVTER